MYSNKAIPSGTLGHCGLWVVPPRAEEQINLCNLICCARAVQAAESEDAATNETDRAVETRQVQAELSYSSNRLCRSIKISGKPPRHKLRRRRKSSSVNQVSAAALAQGPSSAAQPRKVPRRPSAIFNTTFIASQTFHTSMNDLNGRVAFVTGASGGQLLLTNAANWRRIGAAIARTLATFPLKGLALHYSRSFDAAKSVREEIAAENPALNVTLHQADLAEPEQCESLAREVLKTHAKIDIFVSNAGGARRITDILYHFLHFKLIGVSRQVSWEEFDRTLNLNLRASFILTKELIAPMREQRWGRIVFVSSIAAQGGGINGPHYAASKGGLTGLMKNLSTRLAEFNISVANTNSPADQHAGQRRCSRND